MIQVEYKDHLISRKYFTGTRQEAEQQANNYKASLEVIDALLFEIDYTLLTTVYF